MASKTSKDSIKDNSNQSKAINKWDSSACKNALDDTVKLVLTEKFNFTETFTLIDIRLVFCALAVGIAGFALLWDHLYPFPLSRQVLATCVSMYFIITTILTIYSSYVEKGIFTVTVQKDNKNPKIVNVWEASSYMRKYDDKYSLMLTLKDGKNNTSREAVFSKSVTQFIDENGVVAYDVVEHEVSRLHNNLLFEKKEK